MQRFGRSGFTLVELLVVISIMGVLIGLLLPALLIVNSIMRRTHCLTNMRSIGEAIHTHESANGTFPPGLPSCTDPPKNAPQPVPWVTGGVSQGAYCQGPAPLVSLLAQLEEVKMYEDLLYCIDAPKTIKGKTYKDGYNAFEDCYSAIDYREEPSKPLEFGSQTPKVYLCPSADKMTYSKRLALNETVYGIKGGMAKGNYVLNWGNNNYVSFALNPAQAGPFRIVDVRSYKQRDPHESGHYIPAQQDHPKMLGKWKLGLGKGIRSTDVRDGTSTTMLISETIGWDSQKDARGVWTTTAMGGSIFTAHNPPNPDPERPEEWDKIPMCDEDGSAESDMPCEEDQKDGYVWASARSRHSGGVNVILVDGGGRFISDTVDLVRVWQPFSTIAEDISFELPK